MSLVEVWYVLVALTLAIYVVLDGFDLGAGILHLWIARTDPERRAVLRSVGPVWDANEVWLIAAGATILLAFPALFAKSFSGFYLPLTFVLWLLLFRALGVELRHQIRHPLWEQLWDVAFSVSSLLLVILFGAALGNIVRGVTFDKRGDFFAPLWTNFRVDPSPGIVDWYTVLVAITAVAALTLHGALWLGRRFEGELQQRCKSVAQKATGATAGLSLACGVATVAIQGQMSSNLSDQPLWLLAPFTAFAALAYVGLKMRLPLPPAAWTRCFLGSCVYLLGMLASACAAIYPYALPPRGSSPGLLLRDTAASSYSLQVALYWWIPGILLVTGYFVVMYRQLPKQVSLDDTDEH